MMIIDKITNFGYIKLAIKNGDEKIDGETESFRTIKPQKLNKQNYKQFNKN